MIRVHFDVNGTHRIFPKCIPGNRISIIHQLTRISTNFLAFNDSRVEKWRGGLGGFRRAYPSGSFVCRGLTSPALLRFHFPLVEPDVQFSRIRLSEKDLTRSRTYLCIAWCPDAPALCSGTPSGP